MLPKKMGIVRYLRGLDFGGRVEGGGGFRTLVLHGSD
jgi:hypothetical protein